MKVLIADADTDLQQRVDEILTLMGMEVLCADTLAGALEMIGSEEFHAIVLGAGFPESTGAELGRRLKAESATATIPVLLISEDLAGIDTADEGQTFCADDFLHRDFISWTLSDHMRHLLQMDVTGEEPPPDKLRKEIRYPVEARVIARAGNIRLANLATDVSRDGLRIKFCRGLPVDHPVKIHLSFPGFGEKLSIEGVVIWSGQIGPDQKWATGIRFTYLTPADNQQLEDYLTKISRLIKKQST